MVVRSTRGGRSPVVRRAAVAAWLALALGAVAAACTGDPSSTGSAASTTPGVAPAPGAPGGSMPPHTTVPSTPAPVLTTPEGGPDVVAFEPPATFRCMADGVRAQITVGWSVPSATAVTVELDGATPPSGIQDQVPYQVPAGTATGIGSTVVFACDETAEHTVTVTWARADRSTARTFTVVRDDGQGAP